MHFSTPIPIKLMTPQMVVSTQQNRNKSPQIYRNME